MKKFALGILSVFIILGGVLLSACDKRVSLSVPVDEVVIFTNDESEENPKEKEIGLTLENSSAGVNVEILNGEDCIRVSSAKRRGGNNYYFTIYGDRAGTAEVKVSAVEDSSQVHTINVVVNTILEGIETSKNDTVNNRSKLFIVKGGEIDLKAEEYFDFKPETANIVDVNWTFEDGTTEIYQDDVLVAEIVDAKLKVYNNDNNTLSYVSLKATSTRNEKVSSVVRLEVLESATINRMAIQDIAGEIVLYQNNSPAVTDVVEFNLKRNDASRAVASGEIVVNTKYDVQLSPIIFKKDGKKLVELAENEWSEYFDFNINRKTTDEVNGQVRYNFSLDAYDRDSILSFGSFMLYLNVGYRNYAYDITTKAVNVQINSTYAVEQIDLYDSQGEMINNSEVNVYSSYSKVSDATGSWRGYEVDSLLKPEEVALDNNLFRISIDVNQNDVLRRYINALSPEDKENPIAAIASFKKKNGNEITFSASAGSATYVSEEIASGEEIYVLASGKIENILENVRVDFIPSSDVTKATKVSFNFIKITEDATLGVFNEDGTAVTKRFISSNNVSTRKISYRVRINGLTSLSGLELVNDNSLFKFSEMTLIPATDPETDFVTVDFDVTLEGANFEATTKFWFEHITGKTSEMFELEAFRPLESVSILNADAQSANVYISHTGVQSYVEKNGTISENANLQNETLSKLMVEAGSIISLNTTYQSLSDAGISYAYLSYETMVEQLVDLQLDDLIDQFIDAGLTDEEATAKAMEIIEQQAKDLFNEKSASVGGTIYKNGLEFVAKKMFDSFGMIDNVYISQINDTRLQVTDNEFKGYVLVRFNGFDADYNSITVVRIFALESFYAVNSLTPNVKEDLLYTTETLSANDVAMASVDVTISLRADDKVPTYSALEYFNFTSAKDNWTTDTANNLLLKKNRFYTVSSIQPYLNGKYLTFTITANSTNSQTSFHDILTITYTDDYGFERKTEVSLEIRNVERVESVKWINRTLNDEIYLNLTSRNTADKNFTISTSVMPASANDLELAHVFAASGNAGNLAINPSLNGQTFNLSIDPELSDGGVGFLYLLPQDMVKIVNGRRQILLYHYETDENGNIMTDEDGYLKETAVYISESEINKNYDAIINGGVVGEGNDAKEVSNFFINNDGEKIYNKNIILKIKVILADGSGEDTAIRVYNEKELKDIDRGNFYYQIMNDITLTSWEAFDSYNGTIFGTSNTTTLTFENGSQNFVKVLNGTIKNLIFAGETTSTATDYAGFIANTNKGRLENISTDIYYDGQFYKSSTLNSNASCVGGLVGKNNGVIDSSFSFGLTINSSATTAGGLVGENNGTISNSGVEFYSFRETQTTQRPNSITVGGNGVVGGLVGLASEGSKIERSYVYAYPLTENGIVVDNLVYNGNMALFVGIGNGATSVSESFAFAGDLTTTVLSFSENVRFSNSYYIYRGFSGKSMKFLTTNSTLNSITLTTDGATISGRWDDAVGLLDKSIWQTEEIDTQINFGFMYLKNIAQSVAVDLDEVQIQNNTSPLQSLQVDTESGILFVYAPQAIISNPAELSELESYNTISLAKLFGLTEKQARSLLVSSENTNVALSTTSLRMLSTTTSEFTITVHSKMDLTNSKPLKFIVLNSLPEMTTKIDGEELLDGQIVMLQKSKELDISYTLKNVIYLNGQDYLIDRDEYDIAFTLNGLETTEDDYLSAVKSNNALQLTGKNSHEKANPSFISSWLAVDSLERRYAAAVANQRKREFEVAVYNGATDLRVANAKNLEFKPSEYASFDVIMATDNAEDNLVLTLKMGELQWTSREDVNSAVFEINSSLKIDASWSYVEEVNARRYTVVVKVDNSCKHLVSSDVNFEILVNALSQIDNTNYVKAVGMTLKTQNVDKVMINAYSIDSRRIVSSVLYLATANKIISTLMPASDAILAVSVRPEFALMTHFTVTYSVVSEGKIGIINLTKLSNDSRYGFYVDSRNTTYLTNGIRVDLTDTDRASRGDYYFRMYASSAFGDDSSVLLTVTYYNGDEVLKIATKEMQVDYMKNATVLVEGAERYLLAKGESATVTISVGADQRLANLYLEGNGTNISLSSWLEKLEGNTRTYTATLVAHVDATVLDKDGNHKSTGVFYVCANVERVLNGEQEIKTSRAVVGLMDFTLNEGEISLAASDGTTTYNGKEYDVLYTYIGASTTLSFNYPIMPEDYNYDVNDANEVEEMKRILQERQKFLLKNTYANEDVQYYINYEYDRTTATYKELTLKEQLYFASNEDDATAIYSSNSGLRDNDLFTIDEENVGNVAGVENATELVIRGTTTGRQLMKLETIVMYEGQVLRRIPYYFVIVVDTWTDEETPTCINTAEEFIEYATESEKPDDYILMNDIVLEDYEPLSTELISSLDGNGYTIHLNSFKEQTGSSVNYALFSEVAEGTTLKNVRVNIYGGGQITVNVAQGATSRVYAAGFAIINNGIIYNCEVVSYFSDHQKTAISGATGLVVKYVDGLNTDPIQISGAREIESVVAGFVYENNASITNSRVGGESFRYIKDIAGQDYIATQKLGTFTLEGQGEVAGFVATNAGYISASFADNMQINNMMNSNISATAGFALYNTQNIQNSYIEGVGIIEDENNNKIVEHDLTNITSIGVVAGFVYDNSGLVKNSYANIAIENTKTKPAYASGFVYTNQTAGEITLCYTACAISKSDVNQLPFSGVSSSTTSLNYGKITLSYFYNSTKIDDTSESSLTSGATPVTEILSDPENALYGFSFASSDDAYDGIWTKTDNGITLVSANKIAFSNRYSVYDEKTQMTSIFYNKSIRDAETLISENLSYGSENNPIIIRNAYDFAVATGAATSKEISAYKEYYTSKEVFGNYRVVNDLAFDDENVDQNATSEGKAKLTTTEKTFSGILDGNGFTISAINLGSSKDVENFGLFAKLNGAVVMNLNLIVDSVHNSQATIVGTLAGTAIDSRIIAISLAPISTQGKGESTLIEGFNIVGGVVGMLFGESKIHDIEVKNIEIFSGDHDASKTIGSNSVAVAGMRALAQENKSLDAQAETLSYAGAVAGYVDIYDNVNNEKVKYSSLKASDYDIVTVHVTDSVNIYGEVAGGLFGYVGDSTYVYDATLELDSNDDLENPSYIISKNLYAGGLIGENYGGLFAVYASHEKTLQDEIEESENDYYTGENVDAERGQMSIFSYTEKDAHVKKRYDDPLYIGGLVGYMGGGYINVGYNKLNVISRSSATKAVGGLIGVVANNETTFELLSLTNAPRVNIYLKDVYASGDLYADGTNTTSAGIVGAICNDPAIGMKNVLAMNYYSYNGTTLLGDTAATVNAQGVVASDKHFMLIGKAYNANVDAISEQANLNSNIYVITSADSYTNVRTGEPKVATGSATVGGYSSISIGAGSSSAVSVSLSQFGFKLNDRAIAMSSDIILNSEHIGDSWMEEMPTAYVRFSQYFLENGWQEEYWVHTQDELFPHIELLTKSNIVYWDVFNTREVLTKMASDDALTVIVRGKVSQTENDHDYADIDLRASASDVDGLLNFETLTNFNGTLTSYYQYMNEDGNVFVTNAAEGNVGGEAGDRPGIILDKPMFENISGNKNTIEGLNIYFVPGKNADGAELNDINYSFVENETNKAIFNDINLIYNNNVALTTNVVESADKIVANAGLVAPKADSTTFININVTMRNESSITFNTEALPAQTEGTAPKSTEVYLGIMAGYIAQSADFNAISVEGINFDNGVEASVDSIQINVTGNNSSYDSLYFGLYAGRIYKTVGGTSKISVGLSSLNSVNINLQNMAKENNYVGGFVGDLQGVEQATLQSSVVKPGSTGVSIILENATVDSFYGGLAFGRVDNSTITISAGDGKGELLGGIYQKGAVYIGRTNIGAIAGWTNSSITVQGLAATFNVGRLIRLGENKWIFKDYLTKSNPENDEETIFDLNKYDYSLSAFTTGGDVNDSIGGYFGYVDSGSLLKITGAVQVDGVIDVATVYDENDETETISVGGLIGKITGAVETNMSLSNNLDISVQEDFDSTKNSVYSATAYVGGVIGWVQSVTSDESETPSYPSNYFVKINQNSSNYVRYNGTVLSAVNDLVFGGTIGMVSRGNFFNANYPVAISNAVYGGAVKAYGDKLAGGKLTVGGVVGEYGEKVNPSNLPCYYTITKSYSYGDVFVNYREVNAQKQYVNDRLSTYNFGGIVGSASRIAISDCSSIMTSFNNKVPYGTNLSSTTIGGYSVGAIAGESSGAAIYSNNKYSSGVSLAYQLQDGNQDVLYGDSEGAYVGYTNQVAKGTEGETLTLPTTTENILDLFADFLTSESGEGHKLNPYMWDETDEVITSASNKTLVGSKTLSSSHNISWVALAKDLAGDNKRISPVTDNLTNVAFVGNGHIIEIEDERQVGKLDENSTLSDAKDLGAFVNSMGVKYNLDLNDLSSNRPNFNLVSGMILDLNVNEVEINGGAYSYGGVAGRSYGNSFVYGVGVQGTLSVGGKDDQLLLAGIIGSMDEGFINECYVDAHISYRAAEGGYVSGIANVADFNTTIKATYSSGLIEAYTNVPIYTFAFSSENTSNATQNALIDCYSITQTKRTNVFSDASTVNEGVYFINLDTSNKFDTSRFKTYGEVVHGCYDVSEALAADSMALAYYQDDLSERKLTIDYADEGEKTYSSWYFSPYVNYGYAAHGFGYLKNVTTYTRAVVEAETATEEGAEVGATETDIPVYDADEYEYTAVSYSDILANGASDTFGNVAKDESKWWYLGVPNAGKFGQMISTIETGSENYDKNYRFVLRYGFDMSNFAALLGKDVGKETMSLVIDGNGNTLNFENNGGLSTALFKTMNGSVDNLRLVGIKSSAKGTLAEIVNGSITNITVVGELTPSAGPAGGVVGELNGSATNVEAVVNIDGSTSIMGGVVGKMTSGIISYSSNSGRIVNTSTTGSGFNIGQIQSNGEFLGAVNSTVTGGVVGVADGGKVEFSYNANAVLGGYTISTAGKYVVGGVVGYANGVTINHAYNTGLVGAGNYTSEDTISYAGGIVGYGASGSVSNSINDAQVEAINKFNKNKSKLSYSLKSGAEETTEYSANPAPLSYSVTMTYNDGLARHVYAYGVGFMASGSIESSSSSTDNIKNDGNIGQVTDTQTLTFDRAAMLDNGGNEKYQAIYNAGTKGDDGFGNATYTKELYISGYDSYGVPARVYMNDNMTRIYNDDTLLGYAKKHVDYDYGHWYGALFGWGYTRAQRSYAVVADSSGKTSSKQDATLQSDKTLFASGTAEFNRTYYLSAETQYYSSVEFQEYDTKLSNAGGVGCVAGVTCGTSYSRVNSTIEKQIEKIDEKNENGAGMQILSINGENVAVVKNKQNVQAVLAPASLTFGPIEIEILDEKTDFESIKESDLAISVIKNVGGVESDVGYQFYDLIQFAKNAEERTITVEGTIFFTSSVEGDISVKTAIDYSSVIGSFELRKNNLYIDESGKTIIDLGETVVFEENVTSYSYSINDTEYIFDRDEENNMLIYNGRENLIELYSGNATLIISRTKQVARKTTIEAKFTTTSETQEEAIGAAEYTTETLTLIGYTTGTLGNLSFEDVTAAIVDSDSGEEQTIVTGKKIALENILSKFGNTSKLAFGDNSNYMVSYNNGRWSVVDDSLDDGVLVSIEQGYLVFSSSTTDGTTETKTDVVIDETFLANMAYWQVYYAKTGTIASETGYSYISRNYAGEMFNLTFAPADNGDFKINTYSQKVEYSGSNFEASTGTNVETVTTNFCGIDFVSKKVPITYSKLLSAQAILRKANVGYELSVTDSQGKLKFVKQGYVGDSVSTSVDLPSTASSGDVVRFTTFKQKIYEGTEELTNYIYATGESNSISFRSYSESGDEEENESETISYSVTKTKYPETVTDGESSITSDNCPYCGGTCNSISTRKDYMKDNWVRDDVMYNYVYTIYDCGVIEVEYTDISNSETTGKKFVYKTINGNVTMDEYTMVQSAEKSYVTDASGNRIDTNGDGEINEDDMQYSYSWKQESGVELNFDYMQKYGDITIDFIVTGFDANNVYVARNSVKNEDGEFVGLNVYVKVDDLVQQTDTKIVNTYSGHDESWKFEMPDGFVSGSLKVKEGNGSWFDCEDEQEFVGDEELKEYSYKYSGEKSNSQGNLAITGGEEGSATKYMLLAADFSLGKKNYGENNVSIFGDNYVLRFSSSITSSSSASLFKANSGNIVDLNVVGQSFYQSGERAQALFLESSEGDVKNARVFGNIRNVSASYGSTIHAAITTATGSISMESSVAMNVLDAGTNSNVSATLSNGGASGISSKDVLIAGDAVKGSNGSNSGAAGANGQAGSSGGVGGTNNVSSSGDVVSKNGQAGVGGYGGNGVNGNFNGNEALGGGGGGQAGTNGGDRTANDEGNSNRDYVTVQYGGNGGVGGLGRIVGEIYYLSAGGGSSGSVAEQGQKGDKGISKEPYSSGLGSSDQNGIVFMEAISTVLDTPQHYYKEHGYTWMHIGDTGFAENDQSWRDGWANRAKEVAKTGATGARGASAALANSGGQVVNTQVYFGIWIYYKYHLQSWGLSGESAWWTIQNNYNVAWSSGEIVNSGGSYGSACSAVSGEGENVVLTCNQIWGNMA